MKREMTDAEYQRWCIVRLPCTPAERTVHYFMFGYDPYSTRRWLWQKCHYPATGMEGAVQSIASD